MMKLQDSEDSKEVKFSTQTSHESQSNQQNNEPSEAFGMNSGSLPVSSNNSRKVTHQDIEVVRQMICYPVTPVQNLIERCLQLYMNRNEVVNTLLHQARIEPEFTCLVWQKLEEENAGFFKAYYMRLILKNQITLFNQLLEYQCREMDSSPPPKVPLENGIQHLQANNLPTGYNIAQQPSIPTTGHHQIGSMGMLGSHVNEMLPSGDLHSVQLNSGLVMNRSSDSLLAVPGIKLEMPITPKFPFTPTEISELSDDRSLDSVYSPHMTSQEGLLLGPDCNPDSSKESLHPFSQIPWNLSFSDLAGDLSNVEGHEQLGNYSGSDIFLDSPMKNDIADDFFLDNASVPGSETEEFQE